MKPGNGYSELLRLPQWQRKRLKVMEYAKFRCHICGNKNECLHVHHSYYTRGKKPWQYPDGSLICICETCHGKIHPERRAKSPLMQQPAVLPEIAEKGFGSIFAALHRTTDKEMQ